MLKDSVFLEICENLPVVARNNLQGKGNLWYEELIPRQSIFWFTVLYPKMDIVNEVIKKTKEGIPFQVGANATVGMGFCEITEVLKVEVPGQEEIQPDSTIEETAETAENNDKTSQI